MLRSSDLYIHVLNLLLIIVTFNLNGLVYLFTGSTAALSFIILLFSFYLLVAAKNRKLYTVAKVYFIYLLLYLIVGLIALLLNETIAPKISQTISDILKSFLLIFSTYFAFVHCIKRFGEKPIIIIAWSIILSVVLSYFIDFIGVTNEISRYRTDSRLSGIFANPNELAAQSLFSLIFIWFLLKKKGKSIFTKILLYAFMIISFVVLVKAFSRSIFLALIIIIILKVMLFSKLNFKLSIGIAVAIFAFAIYAPIYYNSLDVSDQKRMNATLELTEGDFADVNTGGRIGLAEHGMEIITESPFFGKGIGVMQHMAGVGGVHNAYLAIWGNAGIFVFLFFLFFLLFFLKRLFVIGKMTRDPTFFFLILTIVLNGLTKTGVYEFKINNIIFALCMAVLSVNYGKLMTNEK